MIAVALWTLWKAMRRKNSLSGLATTWLIVLVVMVVGGLSKHDQYEKLLWLGMGTSLCFRVPDDSVKHPQAS
jgi:peptidoglycan/LPS O-acetylase OafA/YrhL